MFAFDQWISQQMTSSKVQNTAQYEQDTNMNLSSIPVYIPGNDQLQCNMTLNGLIKACCFDSPCVVPCLLLLILGFNCHLLGPILAFKVASHDCLCSWYSLIATRASSTWQKRISPLQSGCSQLPLSYKIMSTQIIIILTELCSCSWMLIPSISSPSFFRLGVPPYRK